MSAGEWYTSIVTFVVTVTTRFWWPVLRKVLTPIIKPVLGWIGHELEDEAKDHIWNKIWHHRKESDKMSAVVKFDLGDAPKPRKLGSGLLAIRAPLPLNLRKGTAHINLGIKCDHALLLLPGRVRPVVAGFTVMPGQVVAVDVTIDDDELFETGETVLYAAPLGASDFEVA